MQKKKGKDRLKHRERVIVAISGGVDSSVAAALLKQRGFDVIGIFMHLWAEKLPFEKNYHGLANKCCSLEAQSSAKKVAQILGIPFYTLNFEKEFKKYVVDYFVKEYGRGFTPNPCIMCNKKIKFDFLLKKAMALNADYLATGHYARKLKAQSPKFKTTTRSSKPTNVQYKLLKAKDRQKDQSYFLYNLTQNQLKHLLFPIGDYTKPEVRKLAQKFKLPTAYRRESQGVCFILEKDQSKFLKRHIKKIKPGPILTTIGENMGHHEGLTFYTIGQRKRVKIGGTGPYYVAGTNYKKNILVVTNDLKDPALFSKKIIVSRVGWVAGTPSKLPLRALAAVRYRQKASQAKISKFGGGGKSMNYLVEFKKPQRAVTIGQSVVFYRGEELIGGGVIKKFCFKQGHFALMIA
jgi:tRNA-specific 2-thiouridylase